MIEIILKKIKETAARPLIIAIDGMCGSGKTTLAGELAKLTGAPVIHTDDFFIPRDKRTGNESINLDAARYEKEVLQPLKEKLPLRYGVFDCATQKITEYVTVAPCDIYIIEGSYCLHPGLSQVAALRVFMQISKAEQKRRIVSRNGEEGFKSFQDKWIPLENSYFEKHGIKERCNVIL